MHLLYAILSLACAVSAIDIFFHANSDCTGPSKLGCYAQNPNACCSANGVSGSFASVGFYGIPLDWDIVIGGYTEKEGTNNCPTELLRASTRGRSYYCLAHPARFTGARWMFAPKKRDGGIEESVGLEGVEPGVLVRADGKE
ncbi:hypothetical protein DE146DRAFT_629757 [Phaeosphaeria sp. MPI-PUGE-AT-0046c]|nr:hypothetical protein DE146DRAFT_629757 [Phaeosphaeria sp. MPI-PUGE-AT-0046c]